VAATAPQATTDARRMMIFARTGFSPCKDYGRAFRRLFILVLRHGMLNNYYLISPIKKLQNII
jgi:hypothetical protein